MKRPRFRTPVQVRLLCVLVFVALECVLPTLSMADHSAINDAGVDAYQEAIKTWRQRRHQGLARSDGWLTLVGLEWLREGENRIGSAADNDIQLPGGPAYWGSVFLQGTQLRFTNSAGNSVRVNTKPSQQAHLIPDTEGRPTVVSSGTLSFYAIFRESYALRIKDSQAKALLDFNGVQNYPISREWRIEGRFSRSSPGTVIDIVNVLGQVSESPVFGAFEFEMNGKTHRLLGLGTEESESLWFIFADRTSGHGSYGAGRFLYSDGMPVNGSLTVDFNKAYNPPCVFTPYATCPLPPQSNRLDLMVTAGEKDFHSDAD